MQSSILLVPLMSHLTLAALGLLLSRNRTLQHAAGLLAGLLAWLSSLYILTVAMRGDVLTYRLGGWQPLFGIVLTADLLSALFLVMATTVLLTGIIYTLGCRDKCVAYPAFMPLFLCMGAGLNGALLTGDLFNMFVFIELMVVASVTLVAISDNRLGLEAAIKYLFISAMGSLFLLVGIAALYASFGALNMAEIARLLSAGQRPLLAQTAAVMLMCAFLLKSAVFPFHFWQPDFHTTAPTPVSAMLSSVVVKVGVYGLIRLTTLFFIAEAALIQNLLLILGLIGVFFGSLGALRTYDAKRMLAYSTFGQIGFILVAIGLGSGPALVAALVYTFNHAFIKSALLMIAGAIASRTPQKTSRLADLGGIGKNMPLTGALYLIGGLALAGVPPLNGFISKLALALSAVQAQRWVVLGLVVSAGVITLLYTVRTWQWLFQRSPAPETQIKPYGDSLLAPAILVGLCLLLGLFATPLVDLANQAVGQLGSPAEYIQAVLGG